MRMEEDRGDDARTAASRMSQGRAPGPAGRGPGGGARPAIRAVVFDVGNVMLAWEAQAAVAGRVSTRAWEEFVAGADFPALNARSDAGEPFEDIVADLAAAHPQRPDWVGILRTYRRHHVESLPGPVPGVAALVDDLLQVGMPLYALTNFDAEPFENARHLLPALDGFVGIVVSGQEHVAKPDAEIYRRLIERYDLEAAHTLFVDDSAANVAGARAQGLQTHLFTGVGRLRAELIERGVLPAPVD